MPNCSVSFEVNSQFDEKFTIVGRI